MEINKTFSHWTTIYDPDFLKVRIITKVHKSLNPIFDPFHIAGSPTKLDRPGSQPGVHRWGEGRRPQADQRDAQVGLPQKSQKIKIPKKKKTKVSLIRTMF